jgi:translation initiation factor IF-1
VDAPRGIEGVIAAQLPSGLYHVEVAGARITAHAADGPARNFIRLLVGDRVVVEVAAGDASRGRIVSRL